MVEVTTADVANGGFVVGAGLQGTRPIYVVRYQGFQWYNAPIILNYACKSKEIWNIPCPIFIRSIAMEGYRTCSWILTSSFIIGCQV